MWQVTNVVSCPQCPAVLSYPHTAACNCKRKTFLIPYFPLSHNDLAYLDPTPFGPKIIASQATMLGLFLRSPLQTVTPLYSQDFQPYPPCLPFKEEDIERPRRLKAFTTMEKRARAWLSLSLCFRALFLLYPIVFSAFPPLNWILLFPGTLLGLLYLAVDVLGLPTVRVSACCECLCRFAVLLPSFTLSLLNLFYYFCELWPLSAWCIVAPPRIPQAAVSKKGIFGCCFWMLQGWCLVPSWLDLSVLFWLP